MDFYDLIRTRYSCRRYLDKPVERELVEKVIAAAGRAPSACNNQPWRFIAVTEAKRRKDLLEAYGQNWFVNAPVIIAACGLREKGWKRGADGRDYTWVDVAIAFDHLTLAAAREGLGTCWIGAFQDAAARRLLELPEGVDLVAMTPLGRPAEGNTNPRPRKALGEILCWQKWEKPL